MRPTIVLVHGAFAESASWDDVVDPLLDAGHSVVAAANPLRSVKTDAAAVSDVVRTIDGPAVLVGHSYGGMVISNVDRDAGDIPGSSTSPPSRRRRATAPSRWRACSRAALWATRCSQPHAATAPPTSRSSRIVSTPSSAPTCRRARPAGWPSRSGPSHAVSVAHPAATARLILEAAAVQVGV